MTTTFEAVYEKGVLRPLQPVQLAEGSQVEVTVRPTRTPVDPQDAARRLASIAAKSPRGDEAETASRDHDQFLYGNEERK